MLVLPGVKRFSNIPLTEDEVEFLEKIKDFKFSDDQKLYFLTEMAKNILREEESVSECTKEYLNDGYSDNDSKYFGERHRDDLRTNDVVWEIPFDYYGDRGIWIKDKKYNNWKSSKGKVVLVVIAIAVITLLNS